MFQLSSSPFPFIFPCISFPFPEFLLIFFSFKFYCLRLRETVFWGSWALLDLSPLLQTVFSLFSFCPVLSLCFCPLFSLSPSDLGYLNVFPNRKEFWYITSFFFFLFQETHLTPVQERLEKGNISVSERLFLKVVLQTWTLWRGPLTHKNSSRRSGQLDGQTYKFQYRLSWKIANNSFINPVFGLPLSVQLTRWHLYQEVIAKCHGKKVFLFLPLTFFLSLFPLAGLARLLGNPMHTVTHPFPLWTSLRFYDLTLCDNCLLQLGEIDPNYSLLDF